MFKTQEGVLFEEYKIDPHKGAKAAKLNSSNAKRPERSEAPQENSSNSFKREAFKREAIKTFFQLPYCILKILLLALIQFSIRSPNRGKTPPATSQGLGSKLKGEQVREHIT